MWALAWEYSQEKLKWGWDSRYPGVLLTVGLCGLRSAPRHDEMQDHVQQDDLTNPSDFAHPLRAKPGVLRQACHCVGITLDPQKPWDTSASPPPFLTLGFLPAKGLSKCPLVPGPQATSLTLRSVANNRGGKWLLGWPTVVRGSTQDGASPQPTRSHGGG